MSGFGPSARFNQWKAAGTSYPLPRWEVTMWAILPRSATAAFPYWSPWQKMVVAAVVSLACALAPTAERPEPKVWVRSHNASDVDVYLLCGNRNAKWLGRVPVKGAAAFDIAAEETYCPWGLNFFLVVRSQGRGYWAGPVRPLGAATIELVIEKYAGLSMARLVRN